MFISSQVIHSDIPNYWITGGHNGNIPLNKGTSATKGVWDTSISPGFRNNPSFLTTTTKGIIFPFSGETITSNKLSIAFWTRQFFFDRESLILEWWSGTDKGVKILLNSNLSFTCYVGGFDVYPLTSHIISQAEWEAGIHICISVDDSNAYVFFNGILISYGVISLFPSSISASLYLGGNAFFGDDAYIQDFKLWYNKVFSLSSSVVPHSWLSFTPGIFKGI